MTQREAYVWLSQVFSYGSNKPAELLQKFQDPVIIFEQRKDLEAEFLTKTDVERLKRAEPDRGEKILTQCQKLGIRVLTMADEDFPERLRYIYAPPCAVYVLGDLGDVDDSVAIAVVGTRKATEYGLRTTGNLCYELARCGCTIVSGCAVGIDSYAHIGALKAGGKTIGVLGCGLDIDYPKPSHSLKQNICRNGALLSELPPGIQPMREYFPHRNRLMSALSLGVLVAEAPLKSGALITADHGIEQGKDVFCIPPHDIFSAAYEGSVKFLREGAKPVYGARDILEEYLGTYADVLNLEQVEKLYAPRTEVKEQRGSTIPTEEDKPSKPEAPTPKKERKKKQAEPEEPPLNQKDPPPPELTDDERAVYEVVEFLPQPVDILAEKLGWPAQKVLTVLTEMEIVGLVHCYSGRRYGLLRRGSFREDLEEQ